MGKDRVVKIYKLKFLLNIGIGYWRDVYSVEYHGTDGMIHHIILPLCKLELGRLIIPQQNVANLKQKKVNELRRRIKSNKERKSK